MPCIQVKGGFQMRRSAGGLYPKVYATKEACEMRAAQMDRFENMSRQDKKSAFQRASTPMKK